MISYNSNKLFYPLLIRVFILLPVLFFTNLQAQDNNHCGTYNYYKNILLKDSGFIKRHKEIEKFTTKYINEKKINIKNSENADLETIVIPVVFHIIYNTAEQNVTDAQVYSQIDVINEDFAGINYDSVNTPAIFKKLRMNSKIQFCLAKRTPNGENTNGIIRRKTYIGSYDVNNEMKYTAKGGDDIWDRDKYLNVWICNMSGPEAGFSSYPGDHFETDGIVINYKVFGRTGNKHTKYNKGRTLTHEIGHWLNLNHIWGDDENSADDCQGSDQVDDTPNQAGPNYDCPVFPKSSCDNISDIFMNYMDYTNDACMNIFTVGQILRMRATLDGIRKKLKESDACLPLTSLPDLDFTSDKSDIAAGSSVNFKAVCSKKIDKYLWIFNSAKPDSSFKSAPSISYYKIGYYTVTLIVKTGDNYISKSKYNYIKVDTAGSNEDIFIVNPMPHNKNAIQDSLFLNFSKGKFSKVSIRIFNILGQKLYEYKVDKNEFISNHYKLALPQYLKNDIYILQIQTQNGYKHSKLLRIY